MEVIVYGLLACLVALLTCLAACGSKALREFSRAELEAVCRRNNRPDRLGAILRFHERVAIAVDSLHLCLAAIGVWLAIQTMRVWPLDQPAGALIVALEVLLVAIVLLCTSSWIPATLVRFGCEKYLERTWPIWLGVSWLFGPLVMCANAFNWVAEALGARPLRTSEEAFEDEIRTVVSEGHREGLLEPSAREMIEGVIELGDVEVAEIMTPRIDMICLPNDITLEDGLQQLAESNYTRIPVYNKTRDNIVGILHAKDLLVSMLRSQRMSSNGMPRKLSEVRLLAVRFVPETKRINELLHEFRHSRQHMAIVLDEFGGVSGLVTMEDVLEEIVGEIVDEYDTAHVDGIKPLGERAAEALGRVHIEEINDRLGIALPDESDFDTIGGFVFSHLGHVPKAGEEVVWRNIRITVIDASRHRIEKVKIEILDETPSEV